MTEWFRRRGKESGVDDRSEAGLTLVELLVTSMLLSLIAIVVTSFAINTWRDTSMVTTRVNDVDQAQIAVNATTRALRTAVRPSVVSGIASSDSALTSASKFKIDFYSNTGPASSPERVLLTAAWDSTRRQAVLTERRQAPDAGSAPNYRYTACTVGAAGCAIKVIPRVQGLNWPSATTFPSTPIFRYFDNTGTELVGPGTDPTDPGALTAAQRTKVAAIEFTLSVRTKDTSRLGSSTLVNRIFLPNSLTGS